jgi:hypothetical protein
MSLANPFALCLPSVAFVSQPRACDVGVPFDGTPGTSQCDHRCRRRRGPPLPVPRQHCKNPGDEPRELLHVAAKELFGGFVRDPPVVCDQASFELNVCLDGVHHRRVAECENAERWPYRSCPATCR